MERTLLLAIATALQAVSVSAQTGPNYDRNSNVNQTILPSASGPARPMPHGDHNAVSRAIIDPTFTHHAILEDELRVNFFRSSRRATDARSVATLELAYAFSDAFGAEIFVPYVLDPVDGIGSRDRTVLDLEVQPLKWSFISVTTWWLRPLQPESYRWSVRSSQVSACGVLSPIFSPTRRLGRWRYSRIWSRALPTTAKQK